MNIPQGYKQSEQGVIPEDWEIVSIGDLGHILGGGTPSTNNSQYWDGGIPWFTPSEIGKRKYVAFSCRTISDSGLHASSTNLLPKGTILLTTRASIGDSAILLHSATTNQGFQSIVVNNNSFSNEFVYYLLKQNVGAMLNLSSGSTFLEISKKKLASINITVPKSLAEQQAIAEALSDVDALIATLDKKIAKKRLIKQGAMQQFLTGKKRLTRFSAPWVEKKIYEIGKLTGSGVDKKNVVGEQSIRLINFLDVFREDRIFNKNLHFWTTASDNKIKTCNVLQGDVFFTPSSEMPYDIALSAVAMESMDSVCHSYHIYRLRFLEDIDLLYRAYMFKSNSFYEQANVACEGSGKRYVISLSKFNNLTVYYPSNKHEQRAIATILSDMDNEIADLEARRDKYKLIKNGMMQKLLTGQIRLIKPQAKVIPLAPQMPATREIPVDAHIVAGHIVYKSHQSRGWGRTKLQKSLHLIGYIMKLNLGNEYIRNTAGPDDQRMMNYIDQKFKQFRHVNIIKEKLQDGRTHYSYTPTALIEDLEIAYERYPQDIREQIDALLDKLNSMDLAGAEILSTLYAVWNNRIIKGEQITDDLLISDFYAWSEHKAEFEDARVRKALDYIRIQNIIPTGWGQYIDKK